MTIAKASRIENIQGAKAATVIQGISHEVHRPFGVGSGRHAHRLLDPLGQAPLFAGAD